MKFHKFFAHDKVCTDSPKYSKNLSTNKVYTVLKSGLFSLQMIDDHGNLGWFRAKFFTYVATAVLKKKHLTLLKIK